MEWISVKDRLPEIEEEEYLIYGPEVDAVTTMEWIDSEWFSPIMDMPIDQTAVSHWMPLPEPPKNN